MWFTLKSWWWGVEMGSSSLKWSRGPILFLFFFSLSLWLGEKWLLVDDLLSPTYMGLNYQSSKADLMIISWGWLYIYTAPIWEMENDQDVFDNYLLFSKIKQKRIFDSIFLKLFSFKFLFSQFKITIS